MSTAAVLSCTDLMAITGYQRPGDVARCLRAQGIHVFHGKAGPWTTLDLVNRAGGLEPAGSNAPAPEQLAPDDIL